MQSANIETEYKRITETIKEIVLKNAEDVSAIIYTGSWARKEMSYTLERGHINFLNDIDILIITEKKMNDNEIRCLRNETSRAINPDYLEYEEYVKTEGVHNLYVDIRSCLLSDLKSIISRIKYYDIFTDPSCIYLKDEEVIDYFPKIKQEEIPDTDGMVHLFNRMALLVEWYPALIEKDKNLLMLILKAYSAILEALLLLEKKYVISLREKAIVFHGMYETEFKSLHSILPDLPGRVNSMVDMKINFYKYHPGADEISDIWKNARNDIIISTIYVINAIYRTNFELSTDLRNVLRIIEFMESKNGFAVNPYITEHLNKKYGLHLPAFLQPLIYLYIRYLYFTKFEEKNFKDIIVRSLSGIEEPTSLLYLAVFSLINGIDYSQGKVIQNETLIHLADEYLTRISFKSDGYSNVIEKFKEIFRTWELFTFER